MEPTLHIALVHPEIGPNTGNIGRLSLGIGARLHLVHPLGFSTDDKQVRRAGLDYWKHVDVVEHPDLDRFWSWMTSGPTTEGAGEESQRRFFLFSTRGERVYTRVQYQPGDVLVFGCESKGLPRALVSEHGALRIPITGAVRSLNLANAVAVVAMRALQDVRPELF